MGYNQRNSKFYVEYRMFHINTNFEILEKGSNARNQLMHLKIFNFIWCEVLINWKKKYDLISFGTDNTILI
jgi:hypothetical protein